MEEYAYVETSEGNVNVLRPGEDIDRVVATIRFLGDKVKILVVDGEVLQVEPVLGYIDWYPGV